MARTDDFTEATKKIIAARSGHLCAYPNCLAPTSGPANDGSSVNIGEAAHIIAAQPNGPRHDPNLSPEERRDPENGIWMCRTHAALIDRDVDRFPVDLLRSWKFDAEDRAMRLVGKPMGCASGKLASASPAVRVGAETAVLVEDQYIPHTYIFNPDGDGARLTWFVGAFVVQFSIQKNYVLRKVIVNHLLVTVHETRGVPKYQPLMQVYPATASLFYVEIDSNPGKTRREFRPSRYFEQATEEQAERESYPLSIVLDNDDPAQIALRFNAKSEGMYLVSLDAEVSSGEDREVLPVMLPQWIILEAPQDDYDPEFGA